jgi:hypothetical protein
LCPWQLLHQGFLEKRQRELDEEAAARKAAAEFKVRAHGRLQGCLLDSQQSTPALRRNCTLDMLLLPPCCPATAPGVFWQHMAEWLRRCCKQAVVLLT